MVKRVIRKMRYVAEKQLVFQTKDKVKLDFLCVGFEKCGTSSLHVFLKNHPKLYLPKEKETYFIRDCNLKSQESFRNSYPIEKTRNRIVGGVEPTCFNRAKDVCRYFGNKLKIVFCMANPVNALFSSFKMYMRDSYDLSLPYIQEYDGVTLAFFEQWAKENYIRFLYTDFIQDYMRYFEREQLHFIISEEMYRDPKQTMENMQRFIGLKKKDRVECHIFPHANKGTRVAKDYPSAYINNIVSGMVIREKDAELKVRLIDMMGQIFELTTREFDEKLPDELYQKMFGWFQKNISDLENILGRSLKGIWY